MRAFNFARIPKPRVTLDRRDLVPLDIEVGCGVGLHSVDYCLKNPDRILLAIDKSAVRFEKMQKRISEAGNPANLVPVRENAIWFIAHEIRKDSVDNYFFLYPNPYPKKKQANKRWHRMPFMQHVIDTLKKKGRIHLATNMKYYAVEAEEFFIHEWKMKLVKKQMYSSLEKIPFSPRTHFEKKYLERGETCWNLVFEKRTKPASN